ncbi:hypothetical protein R5R35_004308 [Gryllus longicercus]|uniref:Uncharacterized protein n=2 Tax=Gryllus longicercus TaxID=2509291 RepID=A0AAN9ZA62_9ORTH
MRRGIARAYILTRGADTLRAIASSIRGRLHYSSPHYTANAAPASAMKLLVALCVVAALLCVAWGAPAPYPLPQAQPQPAGARPVPREALQGAESAYYPIAYAYPAAYSYYPIAYWG